MKAILYLLGLVAALAVFSFFLMDEPRYTLPEFESYQQISRYGPHNVITYSGPLRVEQQADRISIYFANQAMVNSDLKRITFLLAPASDGLPELESFEQAQLVRNKQGNIAIQNLLGSEAYSLVLEGRDAHPAFDPKVEPVAIVGRGSRVLFRNSRPQTASVKPVKCDCIEASIVKPCAAGDSNSMTASLSNATRGVELTCARGFYPCCN